MSINDQYILKSEVRRHNTQNNSLHSLPYKWKKLQYFFLWTIGQLLNPNIVDNLLHVTTLRSTSMVDKLPLNSLMFHLDVWKKERKENNEGKINEGIELPLFFVLSFFPHPNRPLIYV